MRSLRLEPPAALGSPPMATTGPHSPLRPHDTPSASRDAGGAAAHLDCIAGPALAPCPLLHAKEGPSRPLRLGRDEHCDVVLAHPGVSRQHCELRFERGRWLVQDLGSTHGTSVDGVRLAAGQVAELAPGGTLGIGPWVLRLRVGEGGARVVVAGPSRDAAAGYATRPTIFLRLRADDPKVRELSWQTFQERYAPVILGFARHAGLSADQAEDVLQEVLLAFFKVSPSFEYDPQKGRFRGYLKRATLNVIRRRHRRQGPVSLEHDLEDGDAEDPKLAQHWDEQWEANLLQRALDEVRSHVDPRTWEAFELYVQREVPADEVARRTGLALNSVHQAKSRVLKSARVAMERMRDEEG